MNNKEMKSVKILHLEDNQYDFELISRMLSDAGFETSIRWASSRDEYLAELENPDFDLVLCDFMIPGYNAFGALEDLLERSLLIPLYVFPVLLVRRLLLNFDSRGNRLHLKRQISQTSIGNKSCLELGEEKRLRIWTQNQLSQSEEQYRELYNNAVMGLYRTNQKGEVLLANQTLLNMLGYDSIEELKEINIEEKGFESFNERQLFLNLIDKTEELKGHNSKWMRKDGSYIYVRESARLRRDKDGSPLYYDGIVEDITEKKLLKMR
ncbi:MAG: PAS domain S-box protein [Ignavibacteriales bacterium]|nr:PAS domain S-box protein [Ignavibacteriales bacterium]